MQHSLNRRAALVGLASLTCAAAPALQLSPSATITALPTGSGFADPVYQAITNYSYGMNLFSLIAEKDWDKAGGERAVIEATYGPPLEVLINWEVPATSREGAIEALTFVSEECKDFFASPTILPMVLAALGYLESLKA